MSLQKYDVCIVGGGIIGSTIALMLARAGLSVNVIERDTRVLRGSTLGGFGALTPYSDPFFVGETALFAQKSLEIYQKDWLEYLFRTSSIKVPVAKTGLLQLATTEEYLEQEIARYEKDCIPGYRPTIFNSAAVKEIEPNITQNITGALLHPEPWIDLQSYMGAIEVALGANNNININYNRMVSNVDISKNRVDIITSHNESIHSEYIVFCTGLNSPNLVGIEQFPMRWIRGDGVAIRTQNNKPLFKNIIYSAPGFISPRNTGEMLLGSTYIDEGIQPYTYINQDRETISFKSLREISSTVGKISSYLDDSTIERTWRGWRPASSDDYPILGCSSKSDRIIHAFGFLGLGITLSVAIADAITEYINNGIDVFPKSMNPGRFKDEASQ